MKLLLLVCHLFTSNVLLLLLFVPICSIYALRCVTSTWPLWTSKENYNETSNHVNMQCECSFIFGEFFLKSELDSPCIKNRSAKNLFWKRVKVCNHCGLSVYLSVCLFVSEQRDSENCGWIFFKF